MIDTPGGITIVPANAASWQDLVDVLGMARCHCFITRPGFGRSAVSRALARAALDLL